MVDVIAIAFTAKVGSLHPNQPHEWQLVVGVVDVVDVVVGLELVEVELVVVTVVLSLHPAFVRNAIFKTRIVGSYPTNQASGIQTFVSKMC